MGTTHKMTIKDIVFLIIFIVVIIVIAGDYIWRNGLNSMGGLVEQILLIMLSFVTLVDVSSYMNWNILVPDFFEAAKEKKHAKDVQICIEEYIKKDVNFLQDYSEERIDFILSQLGINKNQFDRIKLELIRMRCIPLKNMEDAKEKIRNLLICNYPIIINQDEMDSAKICYNRVKYYINIMDVMFIPDYASELSSILSFLITEKIDLSTIDKLVIPHDSNFLLGVEVGKRLGKSVVKMRYKKGKIETKKCWDGNLDSTDRVIIIHDVLVSGEQIIDTVNKLPVSCNVVGFFCLITRKEWNGKQKIKERNIPCYEVLEIDDEDIYKLRS